MYGAFLTNQEALDRRLAALNGVLGCRPYLAIAGGRSIEDQWVLIAARRPQSPAAGRAAALEREPDEEHAQRGHEDPDSADLCLIELLAGKDTGDAQRIP